MQALIELLAGVIALLAAAALSSFGVRFDTPQANREVHRVSEDPGPSRPTHLPREPLSDC